MEIDSNNPLMTYEEFLKLEDADTFNPSNVPDGFGVIYVALRKDKKCAAYFGQTTPERVSNRKNEHHCSAKSSSHFDYVCRTHPDLFIWKVVAVVSKEKLDFYEAAFIRAYDTVKEYNSNYGASISDYELDALKKLNPSGYFEQTSRNNKSASKGCSSPSPRLQVFDSEKPVYVRDKDTGIIIEKLDDIHKVVEYLGKKNITESLKEAILNNGIYNGFAFSYVHVYDSINHVISKNAETGTVEKIYDSPYDAAKDIFGFIKDKSKVKSVSRAAEQITRTINNKNRYTSYGYGWTDEAHIEAEKEEAINRKLEAQNDKIFILVDSEGNEYKYSNISTSIGAVAELLDVYNVPYDSEESLLNALTEAIQKKKDSLFGFSLQVKSKVINF